MIDGADAGGSFSTVFEHSINAQAHPQMVAVRFQVHI